MKSNRYYYLNSEVSDRPQFFTYHEETAAVFAGLAYSRERNIIVYVVEEEAE